MKIRLKQSGKGSNLYNQRWQKF